MAKATDDGAMQREKVLRRRPQQQRSRERVDDILAAAMQLVGEKGIAVLTMRDIARASGMPLASIYQYFPNKSAVIATLYEHYSQETRQFIASRMDKVVSFETIREAAVGIIDNYAMRVRGNPAIQDLLNAMQADKALQDKDIAESRGQAAIFSEATEGFIAEELRVEYRRTVFLLFQLAGVTVRMALMMDMSEGEAIIDDYRRLVLARLLSFKRSQE